jgi:hypothetical protein
VAGDHPARIPPPNGKGGEYLTCERDAAGRWRWSDGVAG